MKLKKFRLLQKLLVMTTSDVDAEALSAMRRANAMMEADGVAWDRFFNRAVRIDLEDNPEGRHDATKTDADAFREIREAFENVYKMDPRGKRADTVADLYSWFEEKGFLTDKQKGLLFIIEEELRGQR